MSNEAIDTLGSIISDKQRRDAVHVAVIPAVASHSLRPGEHVGIQSDGTAGVYNKPLGIVDPFLEQAVQPGEYFWLMLYPRQITSLRHVWSHPDFPEEGGGQIVAKDKPTKEESEKWLRNFADSGDCPGYETLIEAAAGNPLPAMDYYGEAYTNDGEYLHFNGRDAHGDIPDEFWDHLENLKGKKLKRAKYFSCSC